MLTIQEVHFYTLLSDMGKVNPINCPFNEDGVMNHLIISKVNESDEVYFNCVTCESTFTPGTNAQKIIKDTIDKYKNQV
jgi:hypothetical protein